MTWFRCRFLAALLTALAWPALGGDAVVEHDDDDPLMNAAIATALDHLAPFLAAVTAEIGQLHPDAGLKVAFPVTSGEDGDELIWVEGIERKGDAFIALLANEPNWMGELQLGDQVAFDTRQIHDWSWFDGRHLFGHYTTRVLV